MSFRHHRILRKRDGYLSLSGSIVESDPTPTASVLAQDSAATADPSSLQSGVPLVSSSPSDSSNPPSQSSASTATPSSTSSSGNQIPLGTVIGACVAALTALVLAVLLAFYCTKRHKKTAAHAKTRNAANNVSRRRSHLEPWKRMDDDAEGHAQSMSQRPPSGPLGGMFQRTNSNISGGKSSETYRRESVGTMHHFAKYHPGLAAEMASQGATADAAGKLARPPPAVLHPPGRNMDMRPPISWDGETVGGESHNSMPSNLSRPTSPLMMATAKSTPPATTTSLHRWESAEVVHVDQLDLLPNPFADQASSIKSKNSTKGQNPFFSGRDHPVRRTLLADTQKIENPFADPDTPRDSAAAIQSLIAALEDQTRLSADDRIASFQSSVYSRVTADDGESAISVTAFPYPPTQINVR